MDNLLCDESWLSGPLSPEPLPCIYNNYVAEMFPTMDEAKVDEAISVDLGKESCFSNHGDKCVEFFISKKLTDSRFHSVQWLIQTRSRLNLSFETVFSAASCFDRFVYMTSCNEWTNWMVELVVVTSLSIAAKFSEVTSPSLQELQMEGLTHMFHHKTVLEMELIMLKALEWRVNSVTSYSFSQIFASKLGLLGDDLMISQITNHLLDDLCDLKMVQYPPSVVAAAAVWNVPEEKVVGAEHNRGRIMSLFGQEQKKKLVQCVDEMKLRKNDHVLSRRNAVKVKSLVSGLQRVELKDRNGDYHVGDLSAIFKILRLDKKRDRGNPQDNIRPAKRMTFVMSS